MEGPQVALAWVLHNPAIAALGLKLAGDEAAMLEKPYIHHGPSWY